MIEDTEVSCTDDVTDTTRIRKVSVEPNDFLVRIIPNKKRKNFDQTPMFVFHLIGLIKLRQYFSRFFPMSLSVSLWNTNKIGKCQRLRTCTDSNVVRSSSTLLTPLSDPRPRATHRTHGRDDDGKSLTTATSRVRTKD